MSEVPTISTRDKAVAAASDAQTALWRLRECMVVLYKENRMTREVEILSHDALALANLSDGFLSRIVDVEDKSTAPATGKVAEGE